MSIVTLAQAKAHLRVVSTDEDADIQSKLSAAEASAISFLNRNLYADEPALSAAKASVDLGPATAAYETALDTAAGYQTTTEREFWTSMAQQDFDAVQRDAIRTYRGVAINEAITAAILLTLGHLCENRENEAATTTFGKLTEGSAAMLMPYRIEMGV